MMRQLRKCVLIALLSFSLFPAGFAQDMENGASAGRDLGRQMIDLYGSKEGIAERASRPLMSPSGTLTTPSGSSFTVSLGGEASNAFLKVEFKRNPGITFIVSIDRDMDGKVDLTIDLAREISRLSPDGKERWISAICSRGFSACTEGLHECIYASFDGEKIVSVRSEDAGGCYCISEGCRTSPEEIGLEKILGDAGSVIAAGIQSVNPSMAVVRVESGDGYIKYYGRRAERVSSVETGLADTQREEARPLFEPLYPNPEKLFTSSPALVAEGEKAKDRSPYYAIVKKLFTEGISQEVVCSVIAEPRLVWRQDATCYGEINLRNSCSDVERDPECTLVEETTDGIITVKNGQPAGNTPPRSTVELSDVVTASCNLFCPEPYRDGMCVLSVNDGSPSGIVCSVNGEIVLSGGVPVPCQTLNPVQEGTLKYGPMCDNFYDRVNKQICDYYLDESMCLPGTLVEKYVWDEYGSYTVRCCLSGETELDREHPVDKPVIWGNGSGICTHCGCLKLYGGAKVKGNIVAGRGWVIYDGESGRFINNCFYGAVGANRSQGLCAIELKPGETADGYKGYTEWFCRSIDLSDCGSVVAYDTSGTPFGLYFKGVNMEITSKTGRFGFTGGTLTVQGNQIIINDRYAGPSGAIWVSARGSLIPDVCPIPGGSECNASGQCSKACSVSLERDWWRKERKYICRRASPDMEAGIKRADTVVKSTVEGIPGTFSPGEVSVRFRDIDEKGGEVERILSLNILDVSDSTCVEACKVVREEPAVELINEVTSREALRKDRKIVSVYYRECRDGVCPFDQSLGEKVVTDCRCISDFGEAASLMQVLRMAGRDITCVGKKK